MKFLIVYEKSDTGWGAYAPDLHGLGAAGKTLDDVKDLIREAVEFHLEGMRAHGDPIPAPSGIIWTVFPSSACCIFSMLWIAMSRS